METPKKIESLRSRVDLEIEKFQQAGTIGQLRQDCRDLQRALFELEVSLKQLEK